MQVIPDPTTVHFHLPNNLSIQVHREYSEFIAELTDKFPHEKEGILKFYSECWKVYFSFYLLFIFWICGRSVLIEMTTTSSGSFASTYNLSLILRNLCTYWVDFQCFELIGIEVT